MVVFVLLGVLTLVELAVVRTPGIAPSAVVIALVTLAVAKAALIALFYMHLRFETRIMRSPCSRRCSRPPSTGSS